MYETVHKIETRLSKLLSLLLEEKYSASDLSRELNTSVATISRDIGALRQRGYVIKSIRDKEGWRYKIVSVEKQLELGLKLLS